MINNWKPSRVTRRLETRKRKLDLQAEERRAKALSRRRDGHRCRFPLCGCHALHLRLEAAHVAHKGMGGNPTGDRNTTANLITLCVARHQEAQVSIHRGTLRVKPLTKAGCDGPVAWLVNAEYRPGWSEKWTEIARETAVGHLAPLTERQQQILEKLARFTL